jgi:hypothetical protein
MTRTHGRCARGQRLVAKAPFGKWRTLTFLAALRCDGLTAPCVIDGPINGESFRAYVEQVLVPELREGDTVIMDMCGRPHRCKKNLFEEHGAWSGVYRSRHLLDSSVRLSASFQSGALVAAGFPRKPHIRRDKVPTTVPHSGRESSRRAPPLY